MNTATHTLATLRSIVGGVGAGGIEYSCGDGREPDLIVAPACEEEVCEVVRACGDGSVLLIPAGVGRRLEGLADARDARPLVIVCTLKLKLPDDYSHEDLTLTVAGGTTLYELDELVRPQGQHLPIDAPRPDATTLGGLIGCNASGPRSRLHGPIGHSLIGARMVLANGQAIKSGARTVKNVAGYDLHKLWIGSYGSLGILTSVNLRLKPRAEEFRMAQIVVQNPAQADAIVTRLLAGSTRPCLLEVLNAASAADFGDPLPNGSLLVMVGYEDVAEAVRWQLDHMVEELDNAVEILDRSASSEQYRRMVDWPAKSADYSFETSATVQSRRSLFDYCAGHHIAVMARAPTGVLAGHGVGGLTIESAADIRRAAGAGSSVVFTRLPRGSAVPRWTSDQATQRWMRAVKQEFDPHRLFPWPGFLGKWGTE